MPWKHLSVEERLQLLSEVSASLVNDTSTGGLPEALDSYVRKQAPTVRFDPRHLAAVATHELKWRAMRRSFVSDELFSEPGWNILLDLYVNRVSGVLVSVTSACVASDVPPTTALRWLKHLESIGLVFMRDSRSDARRRWVQLTEIACDRIERYLIARAMDFATLDLRPPRPSLLRNRSVTEPAK